MPENSWHAAVAQALERLGGSPEDERWGSVVAIRHYGAAGKRRVRPLPEPVPVAAVPAGRCIRRLPKRVRRGRSRRPRSRSTTKRASAERSDANGGAAGDLIHQLLERLPADDPDSRAGAATRWLERSAGSWTRRARAEIVDQVCGILVRSALRGAVRAGFPRRSAAGRDLARRAGDRRNGRSLAGRGRGASR